LIQYGLSKALGVLIHKKSLWKLFSLVNGRVYHRNLSGLLEPYCSLTGVQLTVWKAWRLQDSSLNWQQRGILAKHIM